MAMPRNEKYGAKTAGLVKARIVQRIVEQEGRDAAAEERIVLQLVTARPLPDEGWVNTDYMRRVIRKIQGRSKHE